MKTLASLICSFALLAGSPAFAKDEIKVLTQNQYLGAELTPLLAAQNFEQYNAALVQIAQQVAANRFVERVQRQAKEIAERAPDVVALQEVWRFGCVDALQPPIPGAGCSDPSIAGAFVDQLEYTLAALQVLGAHYHAVATVENFDSATVAPSGLPFIINGVPAALSALDRDVILVRDGIEAVPVNFQGFDPMICVLVSEDGCNYQASASASSPVIGTVNLLRGFVAVDVTVNGKEYRIVDTHLEQREPDPGNPYSRYFQTAQATELLGTLLLTTPPERRLMVLGDMNSAPEDQPIATPGGPIVPPYMLFAGSGYTDSWTLRPGAVPGQTCCQAEDLSNHKSALYERVDLIWSLEAPAKVKQARVVGANVSDKTPPAGKGIWPSDHGGVAVDLKF
ncbi:MAG: endonuclease/exonuclease/phosphatase family protein [Burkholderiales bacterium]